MSAFMVDRSHIDALVEAARTAVYRPFSWYWRDTRYTFAADAVGQMLVDANLCSIQARYPDCKTDPDHTPGPIARYWDRPYRWSERGTRPVGHVYAPVVLLKAIDCYEYQSCEADDWPLSQAFAFCQALRGELIGQLPGYDKAPWGIEDAPKDDDRLASDISRIERGADHVCPVCRVPLSAGDRTIGRCPDGHTLPREPWQEAGDR